LRVLWIASIISRFADQSQETAVCETEGLENKAANSITAFPENDAKNSADLSILFPNITKNEPRNMVRHGAQPAV